MKKVIVIAGLVMLSSAGFSGNPPEVNEKVLNAFKKTFTDPQEPRWYENANSYEVHFKTGEIKTVVWYNKEGDIQRVYRYYGESNLPPFVLGKITKKLPGNTIVGVTEITNDAGVNYYITLEDEKNWMKIKADAQGVFEVYEKFKKI
jgi:hypothetical protein